MDESMDEQAPTQQQPSTSQSTTQRGNYAKTPQAIRERFIDYVNENAISASAAAAIFAIKKQTAISIWNSYKATGSKMPKRKGGSCATKTSSQVKELVAQLVDSDPDLTLNQICLAVSERLYIVISPSTASRVLTTIGYTMKITRLVPEARNCEAQIAARYAYANMFIRDCPIERERVIWIDETGFNLHLRRSQGRSLRGTRATVTVANSRGRNISIIAAMSDQGMLHHTAHIGGTNSERFAEWIDSLGQMLAQNGITNCWLVLDNARFHHTPLVARVAETLEHRLIFLPPYSPMLNPIENLFSKWKAGVKTAGLLFSRENLLSTIEESRRLITISDCRSWIRYCERNLVQCIQRLDFN